MQWDVYAMGASLRPGTGRNYPRGNTLVGTSGETQHVKQPYAHPLPQTCSLSASKGACLSPGSQGNGTLNRDIMNEDAFDTSAPHVEAVVASLIAIEVGSVSRRGVLVEVSLSLSTALSLGCLALARPLLISV